MKFTAHINIMPRAELLDPQGKATILGLQNLGFENVGNLRVGKRVLLELDSDSRETADSEVKKACEKLLANLIMESYEYELVEG